MKQTTFEIVRAQAQDAAELLDYLKTIGGETDNLSFGPEGVPLGLAHDLDLGMIQGAAQNHTADTAKTIDANFNAHNQNFLPNGIYQTYGTFRIICNSSVKCKPLFKNFSPSFDKVRQSACFSFVHLV